MFKYDFPDQSSAIEPDLLLTRPVPTLGQLHPEAHIDPLTLVRLVGAIYVGNPHGPNWMGGIVNAETDRMVDQINAPEFQDFYNGFDEIDLEDIRQNLEVIIGLANQGDSQLAEHRHIYQLAEMRIMRLVFQQLSRLLNSGEEQNNFLWLAMRGAGIFEQMYASKALHSAKVEMKRLRLLPEPGDGFGEPYAVGIGKEAWGLSFRAKEMGEIENAILPDDCISTGMNQWGSMVALLSAGLRPKRIILPVTVATSAGMEFLSAHKPELESNFNHEFELVIAPGGVCHAVNSAMYLARAGEPGEMLVGDMGSWNESTPYGTPTGGEMILPAELAEAALSTDPGQALQELYKSYNWEN